MLFRDTIAAIATPPGVGGVGLIRVSGSAAEEIACRLFRPSRPATRLASHRLIHGEIVAPETGQVLDEVLVSFLKAPRSYTGEDTLEINCHGGPLLLRAVLEEVLRAGARPADRGEFTKRAFLNDRLDLAQAEAVHDVITAQTREGLAAAVARLKGRLSERIDTLRGHIVDLLAGVEAAIDFAAEEGVVEAPAEELEKVQPLIDALSALAASYRRGRIAREGLGIVIAGRPNVGKSSLLNRLLGEKRAIVTDIPGTTRDFIEEAVDLDGIAVRLTDTAGIRPPESAVEKAGIALVWERLERADAVLLLLDGSLPATAADRELIEKIRNIPLIPVINKSDLVQQLDAAALKDLLPSDAFSPVRISAKYGKGIEDLQAAIRALVPEIPAAEAAELTVAHLRHKVALEKAVEGLVRAREGLRDRLPPELVALEIREALDALDEIAGRTTPEAVLDRIFAQFCIGK
ncbi:MAG: tRNA uridine-5-carboxymethylaminomethyl(34) synthesis GTPase MnmE [Deltaproteobacteria bacterium]|nr:tRNA uridine-5-carboxymethylaminomethyl(34) synthesis GTPase MnmE [Deltaproteobacteria bacterium]